MVHNNDGISGCYLIPVNSREWIWFDYFYVIGERLYGYIFKMVWRYSGRRHRVSGSMYRDR